MIVRDKKSLLLLLVVAACGAATANADAAVRFDGTAGSAGSLLAGVRAATLELGVPGVGATRSAGYIAVPAFLGTDGRWCDDGRVYHGGPCDNSGGGHRPPSPPSGGGEGLGRALAVCRDLYSDSSRIDCLSEVRRARYFDADAVRVCRNVYNDGSKIDCLRAIADADVGPQLAGFCGELYNDGNKIACLSRARRASYFNPDALRVCRSIYSDETKVACVDVIAGRPYGPAVVGICGSLYSDAEKVRCLRQN